jgi:transcriptional regulator with XRE-family HTH domain
MALNAALRPTDNESQQATSHVEGRPVQRSFRGVIRGDYEDEGAAIIAALCDDLDSTGLADDEIADRTGIDKAQLSRIRRAQAHPPGRLIAWAIDQSRHRPPRFVVATCAAAEGEFKPRPPPSVEDRHAATLDVLHDMGIDEVVASKVAQRLGVTRP